MRKKYLVFGLLSLLLAGCSSNSIELATNEKVVTYKNYSEVTVNDFLKETNQKAVLNIELQPVAGEYKGFLVVEDQQEPITVKVIDTIKPVIETKPVILEEGQKVNNWNKYISVQDECDGELKYVVSEVNWNLIGEQIVEVTAVDKSGNVAVEPLKVTINKSAETVEEVKATLSSLENTQNILRKKSDNEAYYSYRRLGKKILLDKNAFGNHTDGLQEALDNGGEYIVDSLDDAFGIYITLDRKYNLEPGVVETKGEVKLTFSSLNNETTYGDTVDALAYTICGEGGDVYTLCQKICDFMYQNYKYAEGQRDPEVLIRDKKGNCDAMSRLMVEMLYRYGVPATQARGYVYGGAHGWVYIKGYGYSDPTWYVDGGGESKYILSKNGWLTHNPK